MPRHKLASAALVALGGLVWAPGAGAAGVAERAGASLAGEIGFLVGNDGFTELATGFRAGYTFPFHMYLGGDLTFYVAGNAGTVVSLSPEVGYDIGVGPRFVIRPYGGLGFIDLPNGRQNNVAVEFYPGCEFLYHVAGGFFLGGDARVPLLFIQGGTVAGLNLMFTMGYKF